MTLNLHRELQEFVRFSSEYANKGTLTNKLVVLILIKNHQKKLIPASPRASERSERGRSALFKNPLFFSGKFLGCYIEAAQNSIRYVPFL